MLIDQLIEIKWNSSNKQYYIDKGYPYTKLHSILYVHVNDLKENSNKYVTFICDYCNKPSERKYQDYTSSKKNCPIEKDCCWDCRHIKSKEVLQIKYGIDNVRELDWVNAKIKNTNLEKYGVENPFANEIIKQKIKDVNLQKFGYERALDNPEIKAKAIESLYKNGTCPTSSQQFAIYNMLKEHGYNVELNFPISSLNLDVAIFIDGIKIDLEYDGSYWHNDITDRRRDEFLKSCGWKILRIKSLRKIPSLEQLQLYISKLLDTKRVFACLELDDLLKVKSS